MIEIVNRLVQLLRPLPATILVLEIEIYFIYRLILVVPLEGINQLALLPLSLTEQ